MIKTVYYALCCLLFCSSFNLLAFEQASKEPPLQNEHSKSFDIAHFTLRAEILSLLELSNSFPKKAEKKVAHYLLNSAKVNSAEHYLLLLAQAKIKQHTNEHPRVIELLEKAKRLSEKINDTQLYLPIFADLYQVLSGSLVAVKQFEKAYQAKKTYIDKFNDYSDEKRDKTIALLTKKYELAHKVKANELLGNQNKLKTLRLNDVKHQQESLRRNFLLIFSSLLFFVLLLWRQFKVRKKLMMLSKVDSLTGVLNRSYLFVKGPALVIKAIKQGNDLSVLLFDIDHFKQVNDTHGYFVGDLVLGEISNMVNETMRDRDSLARLGGEEFVALLPNTDIDKAKAIAVRVVEKVAQHSFQHLGIQQPITLSIGVANINDTSADFDKIIQAADLAMYQAKTQGRNQMVNYATIAEDQERRSN
ncbi:MAG: GGDEF domain-containing protein [Litorilituus sp.]|nr:GGDEF domain-containing protein [Litorilituus sp.]